MSGRSCRGQSAARFKASVLPDAPWHFMFPCVVGCVQAAVLTSHNSKPLCCVCTCTQALEVLGRPFPALFCVCLVAEALREVVETAAARCSRPWRSSSEQQVPPLSLAELASGMPTVGTYFDAADTLSSNTCLFKAATLAQPCVSTGSRQHIQQALLAGQASSPFALFAAQPSKQGWLTLLHALREQHEEDDDTALGELPHSILTPRRLSFPARQQAVVHRATLQYAAP